MTELTDHAVDVAARVARAIVKLWRQGYGHTKRVGFSERVYFFLGRLAKELGVDPRTAEDLVYIARQVFMQHGIYTLVELGRDPQWSRLEIKKEDLERLEKLLEQWRKP